MITMHGNMTTTPSGTVIELPFFNRTRFCKTDKLDSHELFVRLESSSRTGRLGDAICNRPDFLKKLSICAKKLSVLEVERT